MDNPIDVMDEVIDYDEHNKRLYIESGSVNLMFEMGDPHAGNILISDEDENCTYIIPYNKWKNLFQALSSFHRIMELYKVHNGAFD